MTTMQLTDSPSRFIPVVTEGKAQAINKKGTGAHKKDKLTRKEKAYADYLINNPKASGIEAALNTYGSKDKPPTYRSADSISMANLAKPRIQRYLELHNQEAEETVMEVMRYSKEYGKNNTREGASYAKVALDSAKDIQDRVKGKATQRIEQRSVGLVLTVDLSGTKEDTTG